uniref:PhoH-like protein n=1 Tax=Pseudomonas phage Nican01 TaxID=3138540 RepID=A0AAU6W132_9CAUD
MSGNQSRQNRRERRAEARRERKHGEKFPELTASQRETDAKLEAAANRIRFKELEPRNEAQARCIEVIEDTRLAFITGPAGTGKTFLSISLACEMLEANEIERIIITRPMVGCDEDMGFLPGTEWEKFKAWIGPALEVLEGKLGAKKVESYVAYKKIVGAPLMMMRGSTFRNSFVLLDEAQNSTKGQMQMFLTRLGEGSRVVVAGDLRQSDRAGDDNGLADATHRFRNSRVMGRFEFDEEDITRDPLVREVVKAYRD